MSKAKELLERYGIVTEGVFTQKLKLPKEALVFKSPDLVSLTYVLHCGNI